MIEMTFDFLIAVKWPLTVLVIFLFLWNGHKKPEKKKGRNTLYDQDKLRS